MQSTFRTETSCGAAALLAAARMGSGNSKSKEDAKAAKEDAKRKKEEEKAAKQAAKEEAKRAKEDAKAEKGTRPVRSALACAASRAQGRRRVPGHTSPSSVRRGQMARAGRRRRSTTSSLPA